MSDNERVIKMEEVEQHKTDASLWFVIHGDVYDVTAFLEDHPGGDDVLKDKAGQDATQAYEDIGHSPEAHSQLAQYKVGRLDGVPKKAAPKKVASATNGAAAEETPMFKRLLVPIVLVALAYGINYYFTH